MRWTRCSSIAQQFNDDFLSAIEEIDNDESLEFAERMTRQRLSTESEDDGDELARSVDDDQRLAQSQQ